MKKAERTKQSIYKTAHSLFEVHGYRKTTIDKICNSMGISRTTFFNHFKTKDELLIVSHGKYSAGIAEYMTTLPNNLSLKDKIIMMYQEGISQSVEYVNLMKRLVKLNQASVTHDHIVQFDKHFYSVCYKLITEEYPTADKVYVERLAKVVTKIFASNLIFHIIRKDEYYAINAMTEDIDFLWDNVKL